MAKNSGIGQIAPSALAAAVLAVLALGASHNAGGQSSPSKDELAQNFAAEHEIGRRFHIDLNDLPAPKTPPIVTNRSLTVPFNGQSLQVPPGFEATPYVTGLVNPRRLLVLPNGDVLVAEQSAGYVTLLRDDGSGHAKSSDASVRRPSCLAPRPHREGAARTRTSPGGHEHGRLKIDTGRAISSPAGGPPSTPQHRLRRRYRTQKPRRRGVEP